MIRIDIRSNIQEQSKALLKLSQQLQDKAVVMALNKTIEKGKAEMVRAITAEYRVSSSEVRAQLSLRKAFARKMRFEAALSILSSSRKGRSLNLIHFLERKVSLATARRRGKAGTRNQLGFQIKKQGGTKQIGGAFVGNKGRTIFIREGKGRLPIKPLQTINVPQMFNARLVNQRVVKRIEAEFPIEFARAVRYLSLPVKG